MKRNCFIVLSIPAPWLVLILHGHPFAGYFSLAAIFLLTLFGNMIQFPALGPLAAIALIALAIAVVCKQNPISMTRRR